ncbi:MAG TPA: DNA-binding response regulator [Acidobacterium sp.]|nr:DNA-binding response regulator [Acidobacterium sp.]
MMKGVNALIADDHMLLRAGVRDAIERNGGIVCDEATTGREAFDKAILYKPTLVVIDVTMPELNGIEATRRILNALPTVKVIILTQHQSNELVRSAVEAGARGYLLKTDTGQILLQAIQSVMAGGTFFSPVITDVVLQSLARSVHLTGPGIVYKERLTPREGEVLQLLAEGKSTKEAASVLGTSTFTVETQRKNVMRKLRLRNVSDLVRYAVRNHMIDA